jgi:hypothetical protein
MKPLQFLTIERAGSRVLGDFPSMASSAASFT